MVPFGFDREVVEASDADVVLDVARAMAGAQLPPDAWNRIRSLSAELLHAVRFRPRRCDFTLRWAVARLSTLKDPSGELKRNVEDILSPPCALPERFAYGRFMISYAVTGSCAVDLSSPGEEVLEPCGESPLQIGTLPPGSAPPYVRRVAFWAERALNTFGGEGFGMPDPTVTTIEISIMPTNGEPSRGSFAVPPRLNPNLLAAWTAHEMFHVTQLAFPAVWARYEELREGSLSLEPARWFDAVFEGGAVFAEDAVTRRLHRYLLEASAFWGLGPLADPARSLVESSYRAALFWRYLSERADLSGGRQPRWAVYRDVLAHMQAHAFTSDAVDAAIQCFFAGQRLSTIFADFGAAGALASRPVNVSNGQLTFAEAGTEIHYQEALAGTGSPVVLEQVLPTVVVTTLPRLLPEGLVFGGDLTAFAHHVFEVEVTEVVDARLEAVSGLGDVVFQLLEVRMIGSRGELCSRRTGTAPKIDWHLAPTGLTRLVLVVSAATESGKFRGVVSLT